MKFAAGLIKIFSGLLSAFIFGIFLYYTYMCQSSGGDLVYMQVANVALILFLISAVTFALIFVVFDAYQNVKVGEAVIKKINGVADSEQKPGMTDDVFGKFAEKQNSANLIISSGLNAIEENLKQLNASTKGAAEQTTNTLTQLALFGEQIVAALNSGNDKPAEDHSGELSVLVRTVAKLSSDLNSLNGKTLDAIKNIADNVGKITEKNKKENDLENLSSPVAGFSDSYSDSPVNQDEAEEIPPVSVADFYGERFNSVKTGDISPAEENRNEEEEIPAVPVDRFAAETPDIYANPVTDAVSETEEIPAAPVDRFAAETPDIYANPVTDAVSETEEIPAAPVDRFATETPDIYADALSVPDVPEISEGPLADNYSLAADDPFNPPADYQNEQVSLAPSEEDTVSELTDLQSQQVDSERLNSIFNDNFASEMADLDILKDAAPQNGTDISATDEIDLDSLLSDTKNK